MKTYTKSGMEVELTTQKLNCNIYGRIEANHPQSGKIVAIGLWGILDGKEGLVDLHASVGKNYMKVCLEIPKADYDAIVTIAIEKLEAEKDAEWQVLIDRLPAIELPIGDGNQAEYNRLMNEANQVKFFNGTEMDGVNMAADRSKNELIREARTHCSHTWVESIERHFTFDARKKVTMIQKCSICKLEIKESIEDELSE